jgi:D-alanyl-D-alanine dipeptidase
LPSDWFAGSRCLKFINRAKEVTAGGLRITGYSPPSVPGEVERLIYQPFISHMRIEIVEYVLNSWNHIFDQKHRFELPLNRLSALLIFYFVCVNSCSGQPPVENGEFKESDLVEVITLDSTIHLDIRYATNNNFTGRSVYDQPKAFLQRPAAEALVKVNNELKPLGVGLLVFDGYRPWSVTKLFWDITPGKDKKFVADPKKGSRHNRGCAVDAGLYDIASGKEVQMPGAYDESSDRSSPAYKGGTTEQRKMRDLLISKMKAYGFMVDENEWFHFDFKDWRSYRIQDIPFSDIK